MLGFVDAPQRADASSFLKAILMHSWLQILSAYGEEFLLVQCTRKLPVDCGKTSGRTSAVGGGGMLMLPQRRALGAGGGGRRKRRIRARTAGGSRNRLCPVAQGRLGTSGLGYPTGALGAGGRRAREALAGLPDLISASVRLTVSPAARRVDIVPVSTA
jgi:hypothetical protein